MHSRHNTDDLGGSRRGGPLGRVVRGLVTLALLPAIVLAGAILLPVVAIGRLFGLGRGCGGCRRRSGDAPSAA